MEEIGPVPDWDGVVFMHGDVAKAQHLSHFGNVCLGTVVGDAVRIENDSGREVGGVIRLSTSRYGTKSDFIRPFCGTSGQVLVTFEDG